MRILRILFLEFVEFSGNKLRIWLRIFVTFYTTDPSGPHIPWKPTFFRSSIYSSQNGNNDSIPPIMAEWAIDQGSTSQPLVKRSVMFLVEFYCTTIMPAPPSFIPQQSSSSSKPTPDLTTRQASESTWKSGHVCTSSELLQTNSLHCPLWWCWQATWTHVVDVVDVLAFRPGVVECRRNSKLKGWDRCWGFRVNPLFVQWLWLDSIQRICHCC